MPQAAISPILASPPVIAVAGANPQVSDRNKSRDAASTGTGGFADALKRQMGGQPGKDSATADEAGAAKPADAAPPADAASVQPCAPTDLAALLADLVGRAPFSSSGQVPSTAGAAGQGADRTTTAKAAAVPDALDTEGAVDTAALTAAPGDKYDLHGARNRRAPLEPAANEATGRSRVQARVPAPVQTAPSLADNPDSAAKALLAEMTGTIDTQTKPHKDNSNASATTPAADAASAVVAQLLAAAGMAVVPTPDKALTSAPLPAGEAAPRWQNEFAATATGNKAPSAADFAAVGKPVPGNLPGATGSLTDSKSPPTDALADNFQTALAASGAQQALDHARMADSVARDQAQTASTTVATPLGTPGWGDEVGNKLVWMAGADHQTADLVLTPPNMGRIEVSITVKNEQATANFVAANSEVRDALEQSLPRLREMFANAGISLGQANVSGESSAGQQSGRENRGRRYGAVEGVAAGSAMAPAPLIRGGNGMVDTFV